MAEIQFGVWNIDQVSGDTFCQDLIRKNDTMKIQHQRHHLIWQEYLSLDSPFTDCLQQRILI
jgi:hypothetical protein